MVGTTSKKQKLSPGVEANVKACQNVLKALKKSHVSAPFAVPVDWKALNLPLYPKMIKHPMDLGTIEKKLLAGRHARRRSRRRATRRLPCNHALRRPAFSPSRPPLRRPRSVRFRADPSLCINSRCRCAPKVLCRLRLCGRHLARVGQCADLQLGRE